MLAHAANHLGLQDNIGNIGLLLHSEDIGLLTSGTGKAAATAYRQLRHWQHQARLDGQAGRSAKTDLTSESQAILALWRAVFKQK